MLSLHSKPFHYAFSNEHNHGSRSGSYAAAPKNALEKLFLLTFIILNLTMVVKSSLFYLMSRLMISIHGCR